MAKQLLKERFQQLAGIKSLVQEFYPDDTPDEPGYTGAPDYGDEDDNSDEPLIGGLDKKERLVQTIVNVFNG